MNPTMNEVDNVLDEIKQAQMARFDQQVDRRRRRHLLRPVLISLALVLGAAVGLWLAR